MRRLNPKTGKPFKCGDVGDDGRIFKSYQKTVAKKTGYYYETWEDELTFYRRQTERKLLSRAHLRSIRGRAIHMLGNCKGSSKRRKIHFDLTLDDVLPAIEKGVCELTGLPFDLEPHEDKGFNPYAPSVDRISSQGGYVKGNIRIVLWAVNAALGEGTDEEALPILKAMVSAIEKNVKQKSITSVSAGVDQQSNPDTQRRALLAARIREDGNDFDHHSGAVHRLDIDHRPQTSSRDSLATRNSKVEPSVTLTRIENHGDTDAEIIRLDFSRRHLSD